MQMLTCAAATAPGLFTEAYYEALQATAQGRTVLHLQAVLADLLHFSTCSGCLHR